MVFHVSSSSFLPPSLFQSIVLTLYSIANPDKLMAQAGFYRANVSNSFGWNESSTEAMFQCEQSGI